MYDDDARLLRRTAMGSNLRTQTTIFPRHFPCPAMHDFAGVNAVTSQGLMDRVTTRRGVGSAASLAEASKARDF